jgi:FixJ family two-component response regulator
VRKILVLDDDADLGLVMCELLGSSPDAQCVAYRSLEELTSHADEVLGCDVAILDVNLGPGEPNGIEARDWLTSHGFEGRTVFLTGHARDHPLVQLACRDGGVPVLEKPVDASTLSTLVASG